MRDEKSNQRFARDEILWLISGRSGVCFFLSDGDAMKSFSSGKFWKQ
jgi:hypothetical protein